VGGSVSGWGHTAWCLVGGGVGGLGGGAAGGVREGGWMGWGGGGGVGGQHDIWSGEFIWVCFYGI
jgi:hypothetical protein